MDDLDIPKLTTWIHSKHKQGKHVLILVDGNYDVVDITSQLFSQFPGAAETSKVDFTVGDLWVCVRAMLAKLPAAMLNNPKLAVCMISPE